MDKHEISYHDFWKSLLLCSSSEQPVIWSWFAVILGPDKGGWKQGFLFYCWNSSQNCVHINQIPFEANKIKSSEYHFFNRPGYALYLDQTELTLKYLNNRISVTHALWGDNTDLTFLNNFLLDTYHNKNKRWAKRIFVTWIQLISSFSRLFNWTILN